MGVREGCRKYLLMPLAHIIFLGASQGPSHPGNMLLILRTVLRDKLVARHKEAMRLLSKAMVIIKLEGTAEGIIEVLEATGEQTKERTIDGMVWASGEETTEIPIERTKKTTKETMAKNT
jgi:hypothetical protein